MAEPTNDRKTIRRMLCRALDLDFYARYPNGLSADSGALSTNTIKCSRLTQDNDWWVGAYYYDTHLGEAAPILDFSSTGKLLTLEFPLTSSAGQDTFEIIDIWTPNQIHDAITRAIIEGAPAFPNLAREDIVVEENKLVYSIASYPVRSLLEVRMRLSSRTQTGVVVASLADSMVVTDDLSEFTAGDKVSIYAGTGAGQIRTVATAVGGTVTITANWTTNPDTTSKYRIWSVDYYQDDKRLLYARTDSHNFPDNLYLRFQDTSILGFPMEVVYVVDETELTDDNDTTTIPLGYLIPKALGFLYETAMNNTRVDINKFSSLANHHHEQALEFWKNNRWQAPTTTMWQTPLDTGLGSDDVNPLGWT